MYDGNAFTSHISMRFEQLIYLVISIVFHIYFLKRFAKPLYLCYVSKRWRKVLASIETYSIWKINTIKKTIHGSYFIPYIVYQYEVDNKIYKNDQMSFRAEKIYEPHLTSYNFDHYNSIFMNQVIEILVNPINHQQSVIFRSFRKEEYLFYAIMSLSSFIIVLHFFYSIVIDAFK